jgi:hypothetical protein
MLTISFSPFYYRRTTMLRRASTTLYEYGQYSITTSLSPAIPRVSTRSPAHCRATGGAYAAHAVATRAGTQPRSPPRQRRLASLAFARLKSPRRSPLARHVSAAIVSTITHRRFRGRYATDDVFKISARRGRGVHDGTCSRYRGGFIEAAQFVPQRCR